MLVLSQVQLFVTPWAVACHGPLSMKLSRQDYWCALSFSSPGFLPNPGIEPECFVSHVLAGKFFTNRSLIAVSYGTYIPNFFEQSLYCISIVTEPIYSPTNCVQRFFFPSTFLPIFIIPCFFDNSHSNKYKGMSLLICIFVIISDVDHLFMCPLAIPMSSLGKYWFRSSVHLKKVFFFFLNKL